MRLFLVISFVMYGFCCQAQLKLTLSKVHRHRYSDEKEIIRLKIKNESDTNFYVSDNIERCRPFASFDTSMIKRISKKRPCILVKGLDEKYYARGAFIDGIGDLDKKGKIDAYERRIIKANKHIELLRGDSSVGFMIPAHSVVSITSIIQMDYNFIFHFNGLSNAEQTKLSFTFLLPLYLNFENSSSALSRVLESDTSFILKEAITKRIRPQ